MSSTKTYDVCKVEHYEKDGMSMAAYHQCGVAWPMKRHDGFSLKLNFTIEAGTDLVLMVRDRKERGG